MDLYEQLLRCSYLHELESEYQPRMSISRDTVRVDGATVSSNTTHIDYAQMMTATDRTSWSQGYSHYWGWSPKDDYAEMKRKHKDEKAEEDEQFVVSEEMRRFIEELEKTKKTERGV